MAKAVKQSMSVVYYPTNGKFNAAAAFQRGKSGATGISIPGAGDKTPFFGTDPYGNPINLGAERGTPGTPSVTLQNYVALVQDALQKAQIRGKKEYAQVRFHDCISLDIPTGWEGILHFGNTQPGDATVADPVSREFADARVEQDIPFNPDYAFWIWKGSISAQTTTETYAANDVWFLSEPDSLADCGNGYPGADEVGFIACDSNGTSTTPNVLYTINGGSTWTATTAAPFAASDHGDHITGTIINKTQGRVLLGDVQTDGSAGPRVTYGNFSLSSGDVSSWTNVTVGATNGDIVTATLWSEMNPNRVYVAVGDTGGTTGDIHISTDRGETFSTTADYTATDRINSFYEASDGSIYACGDSDIVLIEKNQTGTSTVLTGPVGSGENFAIAVTEDTIWMGNGTSIYYTRNLEPAATGDWTSSKNFGGTYRVEAIFPMGRSRWPGGDSQCLYAIANDPTVEGNLWVTVDGGGTWEEITNVADAGYNGAYFSKIDDNKGWMVGEPVSSLALIHQYTA